MMTPPPTWTPTLKWHLLCLSVCLVGVLIGFGTLCLLSKHLPIPYQPHTPVQGITLWNN